MAKKINKEDIKTVGDLEREFLNNRGHLINKGGRDTRSDKHIATMRKENEKKKK
jgi:hypothetical protein